MNPKTASLVKLYVYLKSQTYELPSEISVIEEKLSSLTLEAVYLCQRIQQGSPDYSPELEDEYEALEIQQMATLMEGIDILSKVKQV